MLLVAALALVGQPPAGPTLTPAPKGATLKLSHCVGVAIDDVQVPAQEAGLLAKVIAKDGVSVKEGDILALIEDSDVRAKQRIAEAEVKVANESATNDAEIQSAIKTAKYQQTEYEINNDLNRRGKLVSDSELRKFKVMWERSEAESTVAEMKFRIAKLTEEAKIAQLDQTTIDVERRQIKAPFDGLVEKVVKRPGAWVTPGEQVVRLVRMDKVRVEAYLDASKYSPEDVAGRDVTIEVKVPRRGQVQIKTVKGKVDFVSQVVDAGSDIRIFAEVDNVKTEADTWLLRPGATADIVIH